MVKFFDLRIRPLRRLTAREVISEKKYWKKFYQLFTAWLYDDCGHYDNYVGITFKNIRCFFNYLNRELILDVGEFYKQFYVYNEKIAIFPLLPEELNYLIYNKEFDAGLSRGMKEVKDFFVFGCTVALRFSDIASLRLSNIRIVNGIYYLAARSHKTSIPSLIKLPDYAVEIIRRYDGIGKKLLPHFNISNLNKYIKELLELAGLVHKIIITRSRRGVTIELLVKDTKKAFRFCDVATTHTMRRTGITTMLSLGVPEQVVRKISGHSPASKEFYRYVLWAQTYQDQETSKMFEKLKVIRSI